MKHALIPSLIAINILTLASIVAYRWYWHAPRLHSETQSFSLAQMEAMQRYGAWCSFPDYLIPRICDYYRAHPDAFKSTGQGEEIMIKGLASFIAGDRFFNSTWPNTPSRFKIRGDQIVDPWGEPVHFVEDMNHDGFVEARGQRREVLRVAVAGKVAETNDEHRFGTCKHSDKGIEKRPYESLFAVTYYEY